MPPRADKYRKVSPIEHVLLRPEMYIGSIETVPHEMWAYSTLR